MVEAYGWHLVDTELTTREHPAISGDYIVVGIDQDRHIKAKASNGFSNLLDLFLGVLARVRRVRFKLGSPAKKDLQILMGSR